jgi:hypothetical protein
MGFLGECRLLKLKAVMIGKAASLMLNQKLVLIISASHPFFAVICHILLEQVI